MSTENYITHARTLSSYGTPLHATASFDAREGRYGVMRCERFEAWKVQDELRVDLVSYQRPKSGGDWKEVCRGGYGGAQPFNNADEAIKEANRAFEVHVAQGKPTYVPKAWSGAKAKAGAATACKPVQQEAALSAKPNAEKVAKLRTVAQLNLGGLP